MRPLLHIVYLALGTSSLAVLSGATLGGCFPAEGEGDVVALDPDEEPVDDDARPVVAPDAGRPDSRRAGRDTGAEPTPDAYAPGEDSGSPPIDPPETGSVPDTAIGADSSSSDPLEAARVLCVNEINKYRATIGLPPYARDTKNELCADGQSKSDSASGMAHGAFGKCGEYAQNECPGWSGTAEEMIKGCLKMMWDEGPGGFAMHGHYVNMSSKSYTAVTCGFYKTSGGDWWAVQDFR